MVKVKQPDSAIREEDADRTVNEEDEDHENALMDIPRDLLQVVRDILGAPVSQQELLKAWDACSDARTADARRDAVVLKLLDEKVNNRITETLINTTETWYETMASKAQAVVDAPRQSSSSASARKRDKQRCLIIDVSDSDRDSDQIYVGAKGKIKKRRLDTTQASTTSTDDAYEVDEHSAVMKTRSQCDVPLSNGHLEKSVGGGRKSRRASSSSSSSFSSTPPSSKTSPRAHAIGGTGSDNPRVPSSLSTSTEDAPSSRLAQILTVVPDVDPQHAKKLIDQYSSSSDCVERVVDSLLGDLQYPKAVRKSAASTSKGKEKATDGDREKLEEGRYLNIEKREQPSSLYCENAFDMLCSAFPTIPKPHIRSIHLSCRHYYAPSVVRLEKDLETIPQPYKSLAIIRRDKGKGRAVQNEMTQGALQDLLVEQKWIEEKQANSKKDKQAKIDAEFAEQAEEAAGLTIECGCCFGDCVFSKMVQCPDAHLFCMDCARSNAENVIGNRQTEVCCMDQDGCTLQFSQAECRRFLKPNQIDVLERLRSEKAIDSAELEGLTKCPYCPFACIIEDTEEKLMRCGNEECLQITCRHCQKTAHLPKSCAEYADDLKKNNIHKVEEAMTAAFLKKCPKCSQAFIKECNKMHCSHCGTMSCYICGIKIDGYGHFKNQVAQPGEPKNVTSTCALWDDTDKKSFEAVEAARIAAADEIRRIGSDAQVAEQELEKLAANKPPVRDPHDPYGIYAARIAAAAADGGKARYVPNHPEPKKEKRRPDIEDPLAHIARVHAYLAQLAKNRAGEGGADNNGNAAGNGTAVDVLPADQQPGNQIGQSRVADHYRPPDKLVPAALPQIDPPSRRSKRTRA